jgi:hypothetical protein
LAENASIEARFLLTSFGGYFVQVSIEPVIAHLRRPDGRERGETVDEAGDDLLEPSICGTRFRRDDRVR